MTICDSLTGSSKLEIGNIACFTVLAPVLLYSIRWEYLSCQSGQSGHPGLFGHSGLSGCPGLSGHPGLSGGSGQSGHPCQFGLVSLIIPVHIVTLSVWSQFS